MQKVFLTGADGMLGSNLTRELLSGGYSVKAFLEPGRETGTLDGLDIEKSRGNLLSFEDIRNAMEGCDIIIHTAASTNVLPNRSEKIRIINIEGTRNVIRAALDHRIGKMIHVGTANTFGPGTRENPGNETFPYSGGVYKLDYMDSKRQAQQEVLEAVAKENLHAVIVNPTFMLGPYDSKPGSGAMVLAIASGKVPGYTRGGRNYIDVRDVAAGIVSAVEKGKPGECYIMGNKNLSYNEIFNLIAETLGVKPPRFYFPPFIAKSFSVLSSAVSKIAGIPPVLNLSMAKISCDDHYFSSEKAVSQLGLPQTDIRIAINDCYNWLLNNGYIKK